MAIAKIGPTIYAVVSPRTNTDLTQRIEQTLGIEGGGPRQAHVERNAYPLNADSSAYLIAYDGTAVELADLLGVTDGSVGAAFIAPISGYYGRQDPAVWQWINRKTMPLVTSQ